MFCWKLIYLSQFIIILISNSALAQNAIAFQYINPPPYSNYVSINSNVLIRQGRVIDGSRIGDDLVLATGSKSGIHKGEVKLAMDSRTLIFTPYMPFETDEDVTVILKDGLKAIDGTDIGKLSFKFHTCVNVSIALNENVPVNLPGENKITKSSSISDADTMLPLNLPRIIINKSNNPSPGYFFLSASPYLEIVDNEGTPVLYKNVGGTIYDFDLQPDGELTYFLNSVKCFGLDGSLDSVRTFTTVNGYSIDVHDLRVLTDGGYYIFGRRAVEMDLSKIVSGGDTAAQVIEGALQEFDSQGNLIFQWAALDHYNILDADSGVDLTQHTIDFSHFNSIDIDADGNLLISARNLDEITKVNHKAGDIIWRLGGENNQFKFINDNLGFSRQHDARLFFNGNISLFDNGVRHPDIGSSAVEYKLDEINKTATLARRIYYSNLRGNIFIPIEGSVQEMPNGNRVIAWGPNWNPAVTEIKPDDSIALEMSYTRFINTYRSLKHRWKTNLFITSTDLLKFESVAQKDSAIKKFTVYNPHNTSVTINEFFCRDSSFTTSLKVPITIMANDSIIVPVMFKPLRDGTFTVSFNIRNFGRNGYEQMIARQVILTGETDNTSSIISEATRLKQFILFQNYPNPFNPTTTIKYSIPKASFVTIKVYDVLGKEIATLVKEEKPTGNYEINFNGDNLSSGIYFYQLRAGKFISTKKMIVLK